MTATIRLVVNDNDGPEHEVEFILDHFETFDEAVEEAEIIAAAEYSRTGVIPRLVDGTPYWGDSDEVEVST